MAIYKVWTVNRQLKRMVAADSLETLKKKAKEKLGLATEPADVVLEEDGTVVDEDEILLALEGKIFIVLAEGESWSPKTQTDNMICDSAEEQLTVDIPTSKSSDNSAEVQKNKPPDQNSTIPCDVPVLTELPLPDFSLYVKQCLRNKESAKVWNKAVDEAANFYLAFYPNDVDNQKAYRIIGQKLHRAFPDIKREGELPWSTFTRSLSQKMKAERLSRKRKSSDYITTSSAEGQKEKTPKKFRSTAHSDSSKLLSNEDYESHILEMKKEFEKLNSNESHLRLLLKESISNRRDWIRNMSGGRVKPILEKFPCFESGKYIWEEFKIIMTEEVQMDMEVIGSNLEKILRCLAKDIPKKELKEAEYKVPSLIRHLEKETGYSKGKGEKSTTFISVHEDVDEKDVDKLTKSHDEEGPRLILFLKGQNQLEMSVIAADNCRIYCQGESTIDSIMILMACYYVFNLDYPRKYNQCLGFLQQYVLGDAFTGEKSAKYKHFVKKITDDF